MSEQCETGVKIRPTRTWESPDTAVGDLEMSDAVTLRTADVTSVPPPQEQLVDEVTRRVREEAVPVTFDRHVYFVNFSVFDRQSPTFINLARDPIDKAASR